MGKKLLVIIVLIAIIVGGYFYYASYQSNPAYFIEKGQAKFNITDYANLAQISDYIKYLNDEKNSKSDELKSAIEIEAGYYEVYSANKKSMNFISQTPNIMSVDCSQEEVISLKKETDSARLKIKAVKEKLEANKEALGNYYTNMITPVENMELDITQHNDLLYILCPPSLLEKG